MSGGWRKGTCFQEWGPVVTAGKWGGQPGGGGSTGADPALSIVFRDPHIQPCTTQPRRPQSSIYCPDLATGKLNSTSSALLQKGGCFACAPLFPQGWSSCLLPLFRDPLAHSCSPFLVGVVAGPAISTNSIATVLNVSALTPFHRENHGARGPVGRSVRGEPTRPPYKSHLGSHGDAIPEGRLSTHGWAQIGPALKLSPSTGQGITVNHKVVDPCSFLSSLSPWPRISPTLQRRECAWLQTWVSETANNRISIWKTK